MTSDALISGYKFSDLKRSRLVSSRSDLHEKQKKLGFPKPVKTGARSAWWPSGEIAAWVQTRIALRDNPDNQDSSNDEIAASSTSAKPHPSAQERQGAPARGKAATPNKPNKQKEHTIA
jgi:predicted DNA-binding transcriptional regulator AlpA